MTLSINKIADDVIVTLKNEKLKNKKSMWDELTNQVSQEGTWDQELIKGIEKIANTKMKAFKEKDIRSLWETTETSIDSFSDSDDIEIEKAKADIAEEVVNKVLDKADISYEEEEYYNEFDDDEDGMEDLGFKFDDDRDEF